MFTVTLSLIPLIYFSLAIISLVLALMTMIISFHDQRMKRLLLKMEFCMMLFLIALAVTFVVDGLPGKVNHYVAWVSSGLTFVLAYHGNYLFNSYLTNLFMGKGKLKKLPKRLLAGFVLSGMWLSIVIVMIFSGKLYSIGEDNLYRQGPLYNFCGIFPLIISVIQVSFVLDYRKMIEKKQARYLIGAILFMLFSVFINLVPDGFILSPLSLFAVIVSLYCLTVIEQNYIIQKAAYTEIQSGLPNAYGFLHEMDNKIFKKTISNYCAYYIDVNGTAKLNDNYGRDVADALLVQYGHDMREWTKDKELFGRLGGNFFVALIEKDRTEEFINRLAGIDVTTDLDGKTYTTRIASTAGCYSINGGVKVGGQVFSKITTALNYAKNIAKVPYVFLDDELEEKLFNEKAVLGEINAAFSNNEFVAYYQPQVDTVSGIMYGSEALARWVKDGKVVPPITFIPVMEKTDLVCTLDFCILENVCKDIREWLDRGINPPTISVNFSRKNLGNPNLTEDIVNVLNKYDIPTKLIQVEVTETNDEYPLSDLKKMVTSLHDNNLRVAIDDFGTGSSSISMLKEIDFDVLKIDKTFVEYKDEKEKKLLSYIIEMSKAIDINVMAEGVEEKIQVQDLKDMDCTHIQGYVFDKPLCKEDFEKRLMEQKYEI